MTTTMKEDPVYGDVMSKTSTHDQRTEKYQEFRLGQGDPLLQASMKQWQRPMPNSPNMTSCCDSSVEEPHPLSLNDYVKQWPNAPTSCDINEEPKRCPTLSQNAHRMSGTDALLQDEYDKTNEQIGVDFVSP